MSDSLWPHGLQPSRLPCPSSTPGTYSNLYPLSWWCHPTISSSVVPFSSCLQSFPASGSFPMSQLSSSGGGWSFSFNISPFNEHPGLISFRMDWLDLLAVQGTLKSLLQHHSSKASILPILQFWVFILVIKFLNLIFQAHLTLNIPTGNWHNTWGRHVSIAQTKHKGLLQARLGSRELLTPDRPSEMTGRFGVMGRHFVYSGF